MTTDADDRQVDQLLAMASYAESQAWTEHRIRLTSDNLKPFERVLLREAIPANASAAEPSLIEAERRIRELLVPTLGAWLGCWAVADCEARWVGLHEPAPPRVRIGGWDFSPMDAVLRILLGDPDAVSCGDVEAWVRGRQRDSRQPREEWLAINRRAWNQLGEDPRFTVGNGGWTLETLRQTARSAIDPWLSECPLADHDLLCLAGGGGLHGPLYAAVGARVTVVDLSDRQLEHDREVAESLGLSMRLIEGSVDRLDQLADASFDYVVQPVSSCYLPDLTAMYAEVARVLRPGGLYVSQHKQPAALQAEFWPRPLDPATAAHCGIPAPPAMGPSGSSIGYLLTVPAIPGLRLLPDPTSGATAVREPGAAEYVHTLESLLGGLARAGFVIEDLREPPRGDWLAAPTSAEHRAVWLPPYLQVKARRRLDR